MWHLWQKLFKFMVMPEHPNHMQQACVANLIPVSGNNPIRDGKQK
jgi:hypothetical protein